MAELEIPAHELELILNRAALDNSVIKSADLKGMSLTYTYEETVHEITDTVKRAAGAPIHKDLRRAFLALSVHLAVIIEDIAPEAIHAHASGDIDQLTNIPEYGEEGSRLFKTDLERKVAGYTVDGISLTRSGVTLTGSCELSTGELVDIKTPSIKWDESQYVFLNELMAAVDTLKEEIRFYKNGKAEPIAHQTELFGEAA